MSINYIHNAHKCKCDDVSVTAQVAINKLYGSAKQIVEKWENGQWLQQLDKSDHDHHNFDMCVPVYDFSS